MGKCRFPKFSLSTFCHLLFCNFDFKMPGMLHRCACYYYYVLVLSVSFLYQYDFKVLLCYRYQSQKSSRMLFKNFFNCEKAMFQIHDQCSRFCQFFSFRSITKLMLMFTLMLLIKDFSILSRK